MLKRTSLVLGVSLLIGAFTTGCGASTSTVASKLPSSTTAPAKKAAASTTQAPTTAPEITAPETTEPDVTVPDLTLPPDSNTTVPGTTPGGGSGTLPSNVKDAFMQSCSQGAGAKTCECVWGKIEHELSIEALMEAGSTGSVPADLQQKIIDATTSCMTDPSA